jgi:hypothetical protein
VSHTVFDVRGNVIFATLTGDIVPEAVISSNKKLLSLLDRGDQPYHLVSDVSARGNVDNTFHNFKQSIRIYSDVLKHPNLGHVFIVDPNPIAAFRFIGGTLMSLFNNRSLIVRPTLEAALDELYRIDPAQIPLSVS